MKYVIGSILAGILWLMVLTSCGSDATTEPQVRVDVDTVFVYDTIIQVDTLFVTDTLVVTDTLFVTDTLITLPVADILLYDEAYLNPNFSGYRLLLVTPDPWLPEATITARTLPPYEHSLTVTVVDDSTRLMDFGGPLLVGEWGDFHPVEVTVTHPAWPHPLVLRELACARGGGGPAGDCTQ